MSLEQKSTAFMALPEKADLRLQRWQQNPQNAQLEVDVVWTINMLERELGPEDPKTSQVRSLYQQIKAQAQELFQ